MAGMTRTRTSGPASKPRVVPAAGVANFHRAQALRRIAAPLDESPRRGPPVLRVETISCLAPPPDEERSTASPSAQRGRLRLMGLGNGWLPLHDLDDFSAFEQRRVLLGRPRLSRPAPPSNQPCPRRPSRRSCADRRRLDGPAAAETRNARGEACAKRQVPPRSLLMGPSTVQPAAVSPLGPGSAPLPPQARSPTVSVSPGRPSDAWPVPWLHAQVSLLRTFER